MWRVVSAADKLLTLCNDMERTLLASTVDCAVAVAIAWFETGRLHAVSESYRNAEPPRVDG